MEAMSTGFCVLAVYFPADSGHGAQEPLRRIGIKRKERARRGLPDGLRIVSSTEGSSRIAGQHVLPLRIHVADLALPGRCGRTR